MSRQKDASDLIVFERFQHLIRPDLSPCRPLPLSPAALHQRDGPLHLQPECLWRVGLLSRLGIVRQQPTREVAKMDCVARPFARDEEQRSVGDDDDRLGVQLGLVVIQHSRQRPRLVVGGPNRGRNRPPAELPPLVIARQPARILLGLDHKDGALGEDERIYLERIPLPRLEGEVGSHLPMGGQPLAEQLDHLALELVHKAVGPRWGEDEFSHVWPSRCSMPCNTPH